MKELSSRLRPPTRGTLHDTEPLGLFILFLKLPVVLSNVSGPQQAQLEHLHPGQDTSWGENCSLRRKEEEAPAPALPAGRGPPIALR